MVVGHGIFRTPPLERHYRDVRAGQFHPPSPDTAVETIGKAALGIDLGATPRWPADRARAPGAAFAAVPGLRRRPVGPASG